MQNFIVVTVESKPTIVPFNDGIHNLWVEQVNNEPTVLEVRTDAGSRTMQRLHVDESPTEVLRLMDLARGWSPYYIVHLDFSRLALGDNRSAFDAEMEKLGFMPYAITHEKERLELSDGMYFFDKTLPRNSRLQYTLDEARTHIQNAFINLTGNIQHFTSEFTKRPVLTIAAANNIAWG